MLRSIALVALSLCFFIVAPSTARAGADIPSYAGLWVGAAKCMGRFAGGGTVAKFKFGLSANVDQDSLLLGAELTVTEEDGRTRNGGAMCGVIGINPDKPEQALINFTDHSTDTGQVLAGARLGGELLLKTKLKGDRGVATGRAIARAITLGGFVGDCKVKLKRVDTAIPALDTETTNNCLVL